MKNFFIIFLSLLLLSSISSDLLIIDYENEILSQTTSLANSKHRWSFIDSIKIGEQYQIHYSSQGCFHHEEDSIVINRTELGYSTFCENQIFPLTEREIKTIRAFENILFFCNKDAGCTTLDSYSIKYKDFHVLICLDSSCDWNGFSQLKKALAEKSCL